MEKTDGRLFVSDDESVVEYQPKSGKFFSCGALIRAIGAADVRVKPYTGLALLPIVLRDALIHHRLKTGVLLDEDLAECPILPQKNGLEAH